MIDISGGGSGKDPVFVKQSMANPELRNKVLNFIKGLLATTPVFTMCTECNSKEKIN